MNLQEITHKIRQPNDWWFLVPDVFGTKSSHMKSEDAVRRCVEIAVYWAKNGEVADFSIRKEMGIVWDPIALENKTDRVVVVSATCPGIRKFNTEI